jgi:tellurite resistance protein
MSKHQASHKLLEMVKHAMDDLEVTASEYREIMELAHADGQVDAGERAILAQFNQMINDGTIKRVKG